MTVDFQKQAGSNKEFDLIQNSEDYVTQQNCDVLAGFYHDAPDSYSAAWIYLSEETLIKMLELIREKRHEIAMQFHPIAKLTSDRNIIKELLHTPKVELSEDEWNLILSLFYTESGCRLTRLENIFYKVVFTNSSFSSLKDFSFSDFCLCDGNIDSQTNKLFGDACEYFDVQIGLAFYYKKEWHDEQWSNAIK